MLTTYAKRVPVGKEKEKSQRLEDKRWKSRQHRSSATI